MPVPGRSGHEGYDAYEITPPFKGAAYALRRAGTDEFLAAYVGASRDADGVPWVEMVRGFDGQPTPLPYWLVVGRPKPVRDPPAPVHRLVRPSPPLRVVDARTGTRLWGLVAYRVEPPWRDAAWVVRVVGTERLLVAAALGGSDVAPAHYDDAGRPAGEVPAGTFRLPEEPAPEPEAPPTPRGFPLPAVVAALRDEAVPLIESGDIYDRIYEHAVGYHVDAGCFVVAEDVPDDLEMPIQQARLPDNRTLTYRGRVVLQGPVDGVRQYASRRLAERIGLPMPMERS